MKVNVKISQEMLYVDSKFILFIDFLFVLAFSA